MSLYLFGLFWFSDAALDWLASRLLLGVDEPFTGIP